MYYTVYKVTNLINGKVYVGCHKTKEPNDSYLGSGAAIKSAVKKYGKENFIKEIVGVFDNKDSMFSLERELVNERFVNTDQTYNMKKGGLGGWDHVQTPNLRKKRRQSLIAYHKTNCVSDDTKRKISGSLKAYYSMPENKQSQIGRAKEAMNRPDVKEKHRREIERRNLDPAYAQKISAKLKGRVFMHHPDHERSKRVSPENILDLKKSGWIRGRKPRL